MAEHPSNGNGAEPHDDVENVRGESAADAPPPPESPRDHEIVNALAQTVERAVAREEEHRTATAEGDVYPRAFAAGPQAYGNPGIGSGHGDPQYPWVLQLLADFEATQRQPD